MSIRCACPSCNRSFVVEDSRVGSKAKCSACGVSFTIPSGGIWRTRGVGVASVPVSHWEATPLASSVEPAATPGAPPPATSHPAEQGVGSPRGRGVQRRWECHARPASQREMV
jgi:hypothetical protein